MTYIIYYAFVFMALGMIFSAIRFVKGPTAADRTVAMDTLTTIGVAGLVLLGYMFQRFIYVDVALVYAVLGFIGVIVIARYLEGAL
ncbi:cation:proton antiporter [Candidatus Sulfidibacterium hydrothermale]|uniref:monovalent cation/H+ antiporter complex subunit F n=1 Tax=Candidatus Sulfidibacterium hydrothermale TaxID=2875962 RepID=UPI001F0A79E6|nr:monovalent cation/H+ antiporter complex subunit F [Candidatus Sulfidibacterium hydrothermale]UBM62722.1 cation:proton antiporter [Candidatus Sulfidibacterium hydrothermale]